MASFIRGASSSLTPTQHSAKIFRSYLKQMSLRGMFGKKGSGKPIIVDDELQGKAGDTIRYHFIPQDASDGILGQNATVLGNETAISEYYFDLTVDQLAKAYRKKGKMTDQRVIFNARKEMSRQLRNWWAQKSEDLMFQCFDGRMVGMTYTYTATTDLVNGDKRCMRADGTNSFAAVTSANSDDTALNTAMNTGDKMNTNLIENSVIQARTAGTYKMRPIRIGPDGAEFFVMFMSLKAARDLRATAEWKNHALSTIEAGIGKDPIATGALGVWDNVILKSSERILEFTVGGTDYYARNVMLGADAAILGWAQTLDYNEERIDYNRQMGVAADEIRGQCKVRFDETDGTFEDAGVMQVITASN